MKCIQLDTGQEVDAGTVYLAMGGPFIGHKLMVQRFIWPSGDYPGGRIVVSFGDRALFQKLVPRIFNMVFVEKEASVARIEPDPKQSMPSIVIECIAACKNNGWIPQELIIGNREHGKISAYADRRVVENSYKPKFGGVEVQRMPFMESYLALVQKRKIKK